MFGITSRSQRTRRVVVTGAGGFVGSQVVRHLAAHGCQVVGLVRPNGDRACLAGLSGVDVVEGDLNRLAWCADGLLGEGFEVLVHCAWTTHPGTYLSDPSNLDDLTASLALFRRAASSGCRRIVGVGTCAEYAHGVTALSEDAPLGPSTLYAASKAALGLTASIWAADAGVSFVWARLFNVFGPGEHPSRLVPSVVRGLLAGQDVSVTAGTQVRDYMHVEDIGRALTAVTLADVTGAINVASGVPVTVRRVVERIGDALACPQLIRFGAKEMGLYDPPSVYADTSRLRTELRFEPAFTLAEGLADTIVWWREQERIERTDKR